MYVRSKTDVEKINNIYSLDSIKNTVLGPNWQY